MAHKTSKTIKPVEQQTVETQLCFTDFNDRMDAAITAVRDNLTRDLSHAAFFREVASAALAQPAGSTILCAVSGGVASDQLADDVRKMLQIALPHAEVGANGVSVCAAPFDYRLRPRPESLIAGYPLFSAITGPCDIHLEPQSPNPRATWFHYECSRLSRTGAQFYIIKNVDRLQPPTESISRGIDAVSTYAEIATSTGKTHILMGSAATTLAWLQSASLASAVVPIVQHPYDISSPEDSAIFADILRVYDEILPWSRAEQLRAHTSEIDGDVFGSPPRLKKWLLSALSAARARGEPRLTWSRMLASRLSATEREEAREELLASRRSRFGSGANSPGAASRSNRQPGIRKPDRNSMAA